MSANLNGRDALMQACAELGVIAPDNLIADGKFKPSDLLGDPKGSGAGRVMLFPDGEGGIVWNWKAGESLSFHFKDTRKLSPVERAERDRKRAEARAKAEAEIRKEHAKAAKKAERLWEASSHAAPDHPYLVRKGVAPASRLRELPLSEVARILGYAPTAKGHALSGRILLAPVLIAGAMVTIEMIDEAGRKSAIAGGQKACGYWLSQVMPEGDGEGSVIAIVEGVADALTVRAARPDVLVVSALCSGNLMAIAKEMQGRYPKAERIVIGDLGNGQEKAEAAARETGSLLVLPDFSPEEPDGGTDINDVAVRLGLDAARALFDRAKQPPEIIAAPVDTNLQGDGLEAPEADPDAWPAPLPLVASFPREKYPIDALPPVLLAAVEEVQRYVKAPLPMVAASALASLSLAGQAHIDAQRASNLQGPVGLYLLTIAESGERKSTCDGYFSAPIRAYEAGALEAAKPELAKYAAVLKAWEARQAGLIEKIKAAVRGSKPTLMIENDLAEHERDKPTAPRVPRLLYSDATPEALTWGLAKEWPSGGVLSSEAGVVFGSHGMGGDSIMRNLSTLNLLWDGAEQRFDRRKADSSFMVKGARLTVALQVQEATLRAFFDKSGVLARGSGFLARFLVSWPESTQGRRMFEEPPATWPALDAYRARLASILATPAPINEAGGLSPQLLCFTPEAKALWVAFHDEIEIGLRSGGEFDQVRDVASKIADNAARLAALFHLFEGGAVGGIGADVFEGAARIVGWHLMEARRFFGELATDPAQMDAIKLDQWLREQCALDRVGFVAKNYALQHGPGTTRKKAALNQAIGELKDLDRVRLVKEGRTLLIEVNPALLQRRGRDAG